MGTQPLASKTVDQYTRRYGQLLSRFRAEVPVAGSRAPGLASFMDWLTGKKPSWSAATWRFNKAASIHGLMVSIARCTVEAERLPADPVIQHRLQVFEQAHDKLRSERQAGTL